MVSRFLTPFGGRTPEQSEDVFLELPHELNQMTEEGEGNKFVATPRLDVHEADGVIEMSAELPGVAEADIEICLEGDILSISGEKRDQHKDTKAHFVERAYGTFQRSIQLPFAPQPDQMSAECDHGVLRIRFPRVEPERTHRIQIGTAKSPGQADIGQPQKKAIGDSWSAKETDAGKSRSSISIDSGKTSDTPLDLR